MAPYFDVVQMSPGRLRLATGSAETGKVMLPHQGLGCAVHGIGIQRITTPSDIGTLQYRPAGLIENEITITARQCLEASMKVIGDLTHPVHGHIPRQIGIDTEHPGLLRTRYRRIKMHYLTGGMHPAIGTAAGMYLDLLTRHTGKRTLKFLLHRRGMLETLPATIGTAVIFHSHGQAAGHGSLVIKGLKKGHATMLCGSLLLTQNLEHPLERFGGTPQQLVTGCEGGKIFSPHVQLAQAPHRNTQRSSDHGRRQTGNGGLLVIGNHLDPLVVLGDALLDFIQRHILLQLDGKSLAVRTHGTDTHTETIDGNRVLLQTENLVGLDTALPLLPALAVIEFGVDPWQQTTGQWRGKILDGEFTTTHGLGDHTIDIENCTGRIGQLTGDTVA